MVRALLKADSLIALGLMALALYFMSHAARAADRLGRAGGPGGGAFPFWLSLLMLPRGRGHPRAAGSRDGPQGISSTGTCCPR
jgi:putative tricarboxylic transport membrane protein